MYKITDEVSLRSAIDKYIKFYAEERLQERFHCKTPLEVRSEALSAEAPTQYPNTQGNWIAKIILFLKFKVNMKIYQNIFF